MGDTCWEGVGQSWGGVLLCRVGKARAEKAWGWVRQQVEGRSGQGRAVQGKARWVAQGGKGFGGAGAGQEMCRVGWGRAELGVGGVLLGGDGWSLGDAGQDGVGRS